MISRRKERLYEEAYSLFVGIHLKGTAGSVPAGARIPVRFRLKSHSSCYFKGARHSGGCRIYKKGERRMARIRMRYILWGQHECYDAWLQEVQTKFRSMPSVKKLAEEIKEMRRRKKAAEGGIDLEIYRNYKYLQQQRWLNYYEDKLVKQLESVVQKAGSEEGCLTVVVLPEALIRDYELEERKKERKYNYVNPLYEKTVFNFLGPSMRSARR